MTTPGLLLARLQSGTALESPTEEISDSARGMVETALESIPRVGVALAMVAVGYVLSRLLRAGLHAVLKRRRTPSFARVMSKLAGWTFLGAITLAATAAAFPSVEPVDLLAGLGFVSVAVGFAFQDILENTLAGVLLLFRQPFVAGDQIAVQGTTGTVESITIRETRIRSFDGQLILIPNRDVYKSFITVQTHYAQRRLSFLVGIAYENDAADACDVIAERLLDVEGIAAEPPPEALVAELGTSTVNIDVRFWSAPEQHQSRVVLHRAITAVKAALGDAEIEMPADIVALQATPSFKAALQGDGELTPGGSVKPADE